MALSNNPVFAQTPKTATVTVATANTNYDGTGTVTTLLTAGADGALVTGLVAQATATQSTANRLDLLLSKDAGTTWKPIDNAVMAAFTLATTTAQTKVTFVDKTVPDAALRLEGSDKLGATVKVSQAVQFTAEYTNF
jgi:hypothetical protein